MHLRGRGRAKEPYWVTLTRPPSELRRHNYVLRPILANVGTPTRHYHLKRTTIYGVNTLHTPVANQREKLYVTKWILRSLRSTNAPTRGRSHSHTHAPSRLRLALAAGCAGI